MEQAAGPKAGVPGGRWQGWGGATRSPFVERVTRRAGAPDAAISACKAPGRPGRPMLRIRRLQSTRGAAGNPAEASGVQVARMRPGRRLGVPAKPVGFVGWGNTGARALAMRTRGAQTRGPPRNRRFRGVGDGLGAGGPHPGPPRSLLRGVDRRQRSGRAFRPHL